MALGGHKKPLVRSGNQQALLLQFEQGLADWRAADLHGRAYFNFAEVLTGRVADSLSDFIEANDFDLILMATHGRSGVKRWVMGSIADKILRFSNVPVLMVRAPGSKGGI
jgi:nucleotide-binding universal stress UspA family protein